MSNVEWMIVGLGNPGNRYEKTRHNIGWMVCNGLTAPKIVEWSKGRGDYVQANISLRKVPVIMILPTTYMNNSGKAVAEARTRYNVPVERIIVIADEYNFPVGKIHLKQGGSDGGHNGIASVIKELGIGNFWRMRCGIGRDFQPGEMAEYVLSPFAEDGDVAGMIAKSRKALELFIAGGNPQRALSLINSGTEL